MGKLFMLLSAFCFSFSSYFAKVVTSTTSMESVITSFSRFILGTIIMASYIIITKKTFKVNNMKTVMIRAILNCTAIILFSWSLKYTTITNANMLNMLYPIFVILLAPIITKEKVKKNDYLYMISIMVGAYIIANPNFLNVNIGDIISLISAVIAGISILALKQAIQYDEGYLIIFYIMLLGSIINLPFAFKDIVSFEISGMIAVLLSATLGFLAQLFQTLGYKFIDSATGSMISTSRIIISAILGYLLLHEPLNSRIITGIIIITVSLLGVSGYFNKNKMEIRQ